MQFQVRVKQDVTGILIPSPTGPDVALVSIQNNEGSNPKTAIISFAGINQALATFDAMGTKCITYTALNPYHNAVIASSIENIIVHLNNNMMG